MAKIKHNLLDDMNALNVSNPAENDMAALTDGEQEKVQEAARRGQKRKK